MPEPKPKSRKIIHIDMDCFYAAVEMWENPHLRGKPIAVGGLPEQRGVLATCNYEARKFGLHSAMASARAVKLCPDLILVKPNFTLYKQVSAQIHQIFRRYTQIIEPLSLDEAYLDVTDCEQCSGSATWIAQEIRQTILDELHLTASAGIAPLKFLAKIASDQNKPNGQFVITPENVAHFVKTLPLKKIPGVGKVTAQKLSALGFELCQDVQRSNLPLFIQHFGKMGKRIWQFSHGIDERKIETHRERKSIGVENTLLQDISTVEQALPILKTQYKELERRIRRQNIQPETLHKLGVKLKFDDFQTTTLDKSAVDFSQETFAQLLQAVWQRCNGRTVRLIGLHVNLPENDETEQMTLNLG
ncbi:DNA polymerase-4 [Cricetibacter osteomyelitidis]|uniref:DNA polymerase IV n=1 Tax=Cricetibacter osteomyelitidis TaxID=1521931 RepID=A0A4R2SX77_9PAST|nr:DNA polymerase IV [Cricetibacter osteomyelitidis]TCP93511.1 DNA polymerase-4 [Cricetibacter osteomyelitidis]